MKKPFEEQQSYALSVNVLWLDLPRSLHLFRLETMDELISPLQLFPYFLNVALEKKVTAPPRFLLTHEYACRQLSSVDFPPR